MLRGEVPGRAVVHKEGMKKDVTIMHPDCDTDTPTTSTYIYGYICIHTMLS